MDTVWIKLNHADGHVVACMFGSGGVVSMAPGIKLTHLFSKDSQTFIVQETIDEIMALIGSARNGVKVERRIKRKR